MTENYQIIETLLANYKTILGKDFLVYKNHVYRIFKYALILDNNKENIEKYAIASVFHDIGIWTHSFDYLKPSIAQVTTYLIENKQSKWIEEISLMIDNHHKITTYKGKFKETVTVFRKSDWIDVLNGFQKFDLQKQDFKAIQKEFSNKGFHAFLAKQTLKWFLKNPLNPLPMFKV
ncbi:MAG: hypothetical protein L3J14_03670 [Flavobacteriaceae bacterium]|nr:hypothetical protein [Flavobacteriaceae bacterium]